MATVAAFMTVCDSKDDMEVVFRRIIWLASLISFIACINHLS